MKVEGEMGVCHTEWQGFGITIAQGCGAISTQLGNLESTMNLVPTMWMLLSCCTFGKGTMLPGLDHSQKG